jgi:hypothetical protein
MAFFSIFCIFASLHNRPIFHELSETAKAFVELRQPRGIVAHSAPREGVNLRSCSAAACRAELILMSVNHNFFNPA